MSENLVIRNFEGFFYCNSKFGKYNQACQNVSCTFKPGINILFGDVDSGAWGLSYALSSDNKNKNSIIFSETPVIIYNDKNYSVGDLRAKAIYLDKNDSFFSSKPVRKQIEINLEKSFHSGDVNGIRDLFCISDFRYDRRLTGVGNEIFKCLSAIGYAGNKSIYCFPWLSKRVVNSLGKNLSFVFKILSYLNKIVILPTNSIELTEELYNDIAVQLNF